MKSTRYTFGRRLRQPNDKQISWENLVDLPNEQVAFVYQRLSSNEQTRKSIYSIKAQAALEDLAREDGYPDALIHVSDEDLIDAVSGTKGQEQRPGLARLVSMVERDLVESVYVVHISRLYRDQTLINAFALGELFKGHGVIIVTPQMRLNLKDKMHMRLYRMEVERAADELELMAYRLLSAKDLKAKGGGYAGESVTPGYIVDDREELEKGEPNPNYHSYRIHEPHAEVVRTVFRQFARPGMTPTRVARYCKRKGVAFQPFPPELDKPINKKAFLRTGPNPDGSWPVTVSRVRTIATNPAYIGWKFWSGQIVSKDAFPPIIDEKVFWTVQDKFTQKGMRPKKEHDPLPLAGLLYCGNHDIPRRMVYTNRNDGGAYRCIDHGLQEYCADITAHIVDDPISEAITGLLPLADSDVSERTFEKWTNDYEQAKEKAASYRREMRRLESEVDSLRGNLAAGVLSSDQLNWLDEQIQERLARIKELADLESQPIGAVMGHPLPGTATIDSVKAFLENLDEKWQRMPNGLKNAVLRLLLDRITIWPDTKTIRVKLFWQIGDVQEMLIHRPQKANRRRWTEEEIETLREHYSTAKRQKLVAMLPNPTWEAIRAKGCRLGLHRPDVEPPKTGSAYTWEENELIRRYYAGETDQEDVLSTGRTLSGIKGQAKKLGLKWQQRQPIWEWLDDGYDISQREDRSRSM